MKKISASIILSLAWFISHTSWGKVQEIRSMHEIHEDITPQTLVVFDIDNTLMSPTGNLGSDQWFFYLKHLYGLQGLGEKESLDKANRIWNKTQELITVKPVESDTPAWIQSLQKKGIKTMALTARSLHVAETTKKQLRSIQVQFTPTAPYSKTLTLQKDELHSPDQALFTDGILLIGERNNKGLVLEAFLKKIGYIPEKILFIDDKVKHVDNMEKVLASLSIPYFGYRYAALDAQVEAFKTQFAEVNHPQTADLFLMGILPPQTQHRTPDAKHQSQ